MGGLRIRGPEWIEVGSTLAFDLARPGLKKPLQLSGVVVDTRATRGIGIRFDPLAPEQSERLSELLGLIGGNPEPIEVTVPRPTEREQKLEAQVRAMVMEVGRVNELAQQRERELLNARHAIEQLRQGSPVGPSDDALTRVVERLKAENLQLATRLREEREHHRAELLKVQRDAQAAMGAIARVVEAIRPSLGE